MQSIPGDGNCLFSAVADQFMNHPTQPLDGDHKLLCFMVDFKKNILNRQGSSGKKSPLDSPKDTLSQDSIKSIKHSTPMIQSKYFNYHWDKIPFKV